MITTFTYGALSLSLIIIFGIEIIISDNTVTDGSTFRPIIILGTVLTCLDVLLVFFFDETPIKVEIK
jgi:hypothetical protein